MGMKLVIVIQWVIAKAKVPSEQRLATPAKDGIFDCSVAKSTCKPGNRSTKLDGARTQALY